MNIYRENALVHGQAQATIENKTTTVSFTKQVLCVSSNYDKTVSIRTQSSWCGTIDLAIIPFALRVYGHASDQSF
jgi:hypothetical protein